MILLSDYSDSLRTGKRSLVLPFGDVPKDTGVISLRLRRPTSTNGMTWSKSGILRITPILVFDGIDIPLCVGQASGGLRANEAGEYQLAVTVTALLSNAGREFMATATKDVQGYYRDVPYSWIGQDAQSLQFKLQIEQVGGNNIPLEIISLEALQLSAPRYDTKNSVAFDAATSASESSGDGVLSLTHTCSGSDRLLFGSTGAATIGAGNSTSMTFSGAGMTEQAEHDVAGGTGTPHAAYTLVAPSATASQTLTSTLSNNETNRQLLGCASFTGVDQTTPVTNVQNSTSAASPISNTVTGVGADDMCVDSVYGQLNEPAVGANQTQRVTVNVGSDWLKQSSQGGADGGVMSWTSGFVDFWGHIAIGLKAAGGGGGGSMPPLRRDRPTSIVPL